ncbi:hypothetical protein ACIQYS_08210 [Psychrobacillus sp. NPDC096426]|uniref:hypothetical protein n=1 Tax=Psychrobacillus sp. NPDC096426 TaxID=3364491 RepID=UPI0037F73A74
MSEPGTIHYKIEKNERLFYLMYRLLFLIVFLIGITGCSSKEEIISSMLSDDEDRYYITILGVSQEIEKEIMDTVIQTNINKVAGYYINENPSKKEISALEIDKISIFIVFDTESEVFRTNDRNKLNEYLIERDRFSEMEDNYENVRRIAWDFLKENGWNDRANEEWKSATITKIIADKKHVFLDKSYEGKEVLSVSFEDKENVVVGPPLILVDTDTNEVIGYIMGE